MTTSFSVCQCNQTLNLLSRPEYFTLDSNIPSDRLRIANLFTPPHTLTLARKDLAIPSLTLSLLKGPVDLMSIEIGRQFGEFNAYITLSNASGLTTIEPIRSQQGRIDRCLLRVEKIRLEFFDLPITNIEQNIAINVAVCEHTLRKRHHRQLRGEITVDKFFFLACNCTPLYDIMQDSAYLDAIEVSEGGQQLPTLREMIKRNNQTGFSFPANKSSSIRVHFKRPMNNIARVGVVTPRSNVKQIRMSYFDENNQTIRDSTLQNWPVNHVSEFGRENNTLDKLCLNTTYRGIRIDILQTNGTNIAPVNVSLKVEVRTCEGAGGLIRKSLCSLVLTGYFIGWGFVFHLALCAETNILRPENVEKYAFASPRCLSDMSQGYENLRGENCSLQNPEVEIVFKKPNLAYISKIEIQRENDRNPSNIRQIEVSLMDANNEFILDDITDKPAVWRSSANEPVIRGDFHNIRGLRLKVLSTDNNQNVRGLRILIDGCYSAGRDFSWISHFISGF